MHLPYQDCDSEEILFVMTTHSSFLYIMQDGTLHDTTMPDRDDSHIKRMAELMQRGASMLADACPQCGSPLLKVEDDIYCATCDRRIVIVQSDEDVETHAVKTLLPQLRETLLNKLRRLGDIVEREDDLESLTKLANLMVLLLQALNQLDNIS